MVLVLNIGISTSISNTTQMHSQQFKNVMVCACVCVLCGCCVGVGGCASVHMAYILHMFALNTINCKMFMLTIHIYPIYNTLRYSTMSSFGQLRIHHLHLNYLQ